MKTYQASIGIPKQRIVDLFISACEGGSNYWCAKVKPLGKQKDAYEAMLGGFMLVDGERDDDAPIHVTARMIKQAIKDFPVKEPHHFGNFISENDDAETADVFLQLCAFGKTIYG